MILNFFKINENYPRIKYSPLEFREVEMEEFRNYNYEEEEITDLKLLWLSSKLIQQENYNFKINDNLNQNLEVKPNEFREVAEDKVYYEIAMMENLKTFTLNSTIHIVFAPETRSTDFFIKILIFNGSFMSPSPSQFPSTHGC